MLQQQLSISNGVQKILLNENNNSNCTCEYTEKKTNKRDCCCYALCDDGWWVTLVNAYSYYTRSYAYVP